MREILFKGKRKDNNEWIVGYYFKSWSCKDGKRYDVHLIHNYELDDAYEIYPDTLCQLTHMTDINGDRLWENDIVESLSNTFVLQVVWSDEYQEFLFKNIEGGCSFIECKARELSSYTRDKKIKIVGNVFDDFDLIKEG